jgi:hypothetical protein
MAAAQAAPVAMAVAVGGSVTVAHDPVAPWTLTPFALVGADDALQIPEGGSVQLLFHANGRRETWTGPAVVQVRADHAEGPSGPTVLELGRDVGAGLGQLTVVLDRAQRERAGTTLVRGATLIPKLDPEQQAEVDAARARFEQLAALRVDPADITPELFLASRLLAFDQLPDACPVLLRAEAACPSCSAPKALLGWIGRDTCR